MQKRLVLQLIAACGLGAAALPSFAQGTVKIANVIELSGVGASAGTNFKNGVELAVKEYAIFELLALHRGKLVTRTMIYEHVYGEADETLSNVVDVYICNLRKKLGDKIIHTRRGEGYIIRD